MSKYLQILHKFTCPSTKHTEFLNFMHNFSHTHNTPRFVRYVSQRTLNIDTVPNLVKMMMFT